MRVSINKKNIINKTNNKKYLDRKDIVDLIYSNSNDLKLSKSQINKLILSFSDIIYEQISNKRNIQIRGFGTFSYYRLAATKKTNYISDIVRKKKIEKITNVPERATIRFKPSKTRIKELRKRELNNKNE